MIVSDLLNPNKLIKRNIQRYIVLSWVFLTLLIWIFSPFIFLPKPGEIWAALQDLWTYDNLATELMTSVMLNLEAIGVATIVSLGLAYLNTINVFKPMVSTFGRFRFLSMVGLSFFFTIITTSGHQLKLSVLAFSISVFFVTGACDVIASIPSEQYDLAHTLRMGSWKTLYEVVILGQMDQMFVVLRQNAAMGFMFLTMVESMDRSGGGIGSLLLNSQKHFHMASIFAIQIVILFTGLLQDKLITFGRKTFCPYADLAVRG
jgi:NitT/TauT family transport system permease protein